MRITKTLTKECPGCNFKKEETIGIVDRQLCSWGKNKKSKILVEGKGKKRPSCNLIQNEKQVA